MNKLQVLKDHYKKNNLNLDLYPESFKDLNNKNLKYLIDYAGDSTHIAVKEGRKWLLLEVDVVDNDIDIMERTAAYFIEMDIDNKENIKEWKDHYKRITNKILVS